MKLYSEFAKKLILRVTPFVATWVLASAPTLAASLAGSFGELTFTNFNRENTAFEAINDADGSAVSNSDDSLTDFQNFSRTTKPGPSSSTISNIANSFVFGEGSSYNTWATTMPRFLANFDVSRNDTLSFNFRTILDLDASVDTPGVETASAAGDIAFYLLDTTGTSADDRFDFLNSTQLDPNQIAQNNILDSFTLAANIDALGRNNFIRNTNTQNVSISNNDSISSLGPIDDLGGSQAISSSFFEGSLERSFEQDRNVTLLAFKNTKSNVKVPEPETALGSILFAGLLVVAMRARKKAQNNSSS